MVYDKLLPNQLTIFGLAKTLNVRFSKICHNDRNNDAPIMTDNNSNPPRLFGSNYFYSSQSILSLGHKLWPITYIIETVNSHAVGIAAPWP